MATTEMNCLASGGNGGGFYGSFTSSTSDFTETELGFTPSKVVVWSIYNSQTVVVNELDVPEQKVYQWYGNSAKTDESAYWYGTYMKVEGTKFCYKAPSSQYVATTYFMAIKE